MLSGIVNGKLKNIQFIIKLGFKTAENHHYWEAETREYLSLSFIAAQLFFWLIVSLGEELLTPGGKNSLIEKLSINCLVYKMSSWKHIFPKSRLNSNSSFCSTNVLKN